MDISCVAKFSINWSYSSGGTYTFKLDFEKLHLPFVFEKLAYKLYFGDISVLF